tara:strand:+ start:1442 stop:1687 length:246 start_codon:yes stop_codon:yes gene_type:complete
MFVTTDNAESLSKEFFMRNVLHLTDREADVLALLSDGRKSKNIASDLGIGTRTVNKHLERIYKKLGVDNRTAAARILLMLR